MRKVEKRRQEEKRERWQEERRGIDVTKWGEDKRCNERMQRSGDKRPDKSREEERRVKLRWDEQRKLAGGGRVLSVDFSSPKKRSVAYYFSKS